MVLQNDSDRINDDRESKKTKNSSKPATGSFENVSKGAILPNSSKVVPRNGKIISAKLRAAAKAKGCKPSRKVGLYKDCEPGVFVDIYGEVRFLLPFFFSHLLLLAIFPNYTFEWNRSLKFSNLIIKKSTSISVLQIILNTRTVMTVALNKIIGKDP